MEIPELVKKHNGFESFNPMQEKAIASGLFEKNLVVSAPTASGKTVVAELAALDCILNRRKKVVYTCPLRALASEHAHDFKVKYARELGIRPVLSTGDFDSSGSALSRKDMIFTTYEKCLSLLNNKADWLSDIGLLVIDEIHTIGGNRGPTLEMLITRLRMVNPKMQVLGLSATIPNAKELAGWLDAKFVQSDYRPVKLKEGVFHDGIVDFVSHADEIPLKEDALTSIALDTLAKGKQALVFVNTRKLSESTARKLSELTASHLTDKEKQVLAKAAERCLNVLEVPTMQCHTVAGFVKRGACFHNAGLLGKQRTIIEDLFRQNYLKFISSTPTLCLVPETNIWDGVKDFQANSFTVRENVLALKGTNLSPIKPLDIQKIENNKPIIKIESVAGHLIKLTSNHRVLVKRNGKRMLLPACECTKGDKIATVGKINLPLNISHYGSNKIGYLGVDFFYFVGCMLGDGYSGAETTVDGIKFKGTPCIVGRDQEIFNTAKGVSTKFGLKFRESQNSYGVPSLFLSKEKRFRELLVSCGVELGEYKFIPENLKSARSENVSALLQGLFDTDGCVEKNRCVSFSNISINLIKDIQRLLLTFGIVSRIRKRKAGSMSLGAKTYQTKNSFELVIAHKKSIIAFLELIGFRVKRKQTSLEKLVNTLKQNIHFTCCTACGYKLYSDIFSGRNKSHRVWGEQKYQVIKFLGENAYSTSRELSARLGFACYKKENRINHHFELIERKPLGNTTIWKLNEIGKFVYENVILKGKSIQEIISAGNCPLCVKAFEKKLKGGWRETDFEGDVFWDFIRSISEEPAENYPFVYDIVLPSDGSNDHLFAAEGFLVHNSAGVNLPAFRVVLQSPYRYSEGGMEKIPVSEWKQLSGRAGRPKYSDSHGEAMLIAKNEVEKDDYISYYINGSPEDVNSRLDAEAQLRFHLLSSIATGFIFDQESAEKFFSKTFYACQSQDLSALYRAMSSIVNNLEQMGFVKTTGERIDATPLGRRVAELYLDPVSAFRIINALHARKSRDLSYLFTISSALEFRPLLSVSRGKEAELWEKIQEDKGLLPVNVDLEMFSDNELLAKYWTSFMLKDWIEEVREQEIVDTYNVQPGILRAKLQNADWLAYSSLELAKILGLQEHFIPLNRMRKRIQSGIREELIPLCELRGIGRAKGRRLYSAGVKCISDVKNTDVKDLGKVLGQKVAVSVKAQLEMKK